MGSAESYRAPQVIQYGAQPAAGANFALTSPARQFWQLIAATFTLVTDANAATRFVTVDYDDGKGVLFGSNGAQGGVALSTTAVFSFQATRGASEANTGNQIFVPLQPVFFEPGQALQINVLNKQAGDQLSRIAFTFHRLPEAPY
jgi:hypothetical protein